MPAEDIKPDYHVYYPLQNSNCLTRIGSAATVSGNHYLNSIAAGLNTTSDVIRIVMDDYWPAEEILLFRPLDKTRANKQFMANNYVPDFYYFWRFRKQERQLKRLGIASYVESDAYKNDQGFDIDWREAGIRVKQERDSPEGDLILFRPTR